MFDRAMAGDGKKPLASRVFAARVLTAIMQAAALYWLTGAAMAPRSWPATDPRLFVPLLLVSAYVPLLVLQALGEIGARPLARWAALATVVIAGLGYHEAARGRAPGFAGEDTLWPWFPLWLALAASLFIAHVMVVDAVTERRLTAPYPRHFDTAWKEGVQAVLALVFVGIFWGVLALGAGLFTLVDIEIFRRLIEERWFAYPATAAALAVAVQATDVQPSLIRGARSVALTLFSWLLPLLTMILLGFLGSLPFISLTPLWNTRFATTLLLIAAGLLVFLINCCYQDGAAEATRSRIKRLAGTIGAIELIPLVGLAVWALSLRVAQHGWTVARIEAACVVAVAGGYAIGYASAVLPGTAWLKRLEMTNLVAACAVLALVLALFSPIADPARLMVASQVDRLRSGAAPPATFDFAALKFDGAGWGAAALTELSRTANGPEAALIAPRAARALAQVNRDDANPLEATPDALAERVVVYPAGRTLPPGFYAASVRASTDGGTPTCYRNAEPKCVARFLTLRPGDAEAILLLDSAAGYIFEADSSGQWRSTARLTGPLYCGPIRRGLEQGEFKLEPHTWPDLVIGDRRLAIDPSPPGCP